MTENYIILPTDSSNAGKLVRTNQRTVNGSPVEEHFTILQDYTNNNQAKIDSDGKINIAGSISSIPNITINSASSIGSYSYQNIIVSGIPIINANIIGSIVIGSISAEVDSVYIQSGDNINITGMPKTEIYGSGTFAVNIGNNGSVYISNQISEVTVGSESWIKNFNEIGSSVIVTNFNDLGSSVVVKNFGDLGSDRVISNRVAGSIVNMPTVTITSTNLDIRDLTAASDSIVALLGSTSIYNRVAGSIVNLPSIDINNPATIGSWTGLYLGSKVYQGDRFGISGIVEVSNTITGSIVSMPSISTGSESWIKGGSVSVYNRVAGSIVNIPNIDINNPTTIGSYSTQNVALTGSVEVFSVTGSIETYGSSVTVGSESWIKGGSIEVYTGSIHVTNFSASSGYAGSDVWQGTDPWVILGSVHQVNSTPTTLTGSVEVFSSTGSVEIYGALSATAGSESYIKGGSVSIYDLGSNAWVYLNSGTSYINVPNRVAGSIVNIPSIIGSFSQTNAGSVIQLTNPWLISKTPKTYTGSIIVSGGTAASFIGSHIVTLNNEINWISVIGSSGSSYGFEVKDSEGYSILSNFTRSGKMSYMTPFLASGNIVFTISGAQVSGNYPLRLGYT